MKIKIVLSLAVLGLMLAGWLLRDKKNDNPVQPLSLIRANNAFSASQFDYAIDYYLEDLAQRPHNREAYKKIAQAHILKEFQDMNKAIEYYQLYLADGDLNALVTQQIVNDLKFLGMKNALDVIGQTTTNNLLKASIWATDEPEKALNQLQLVANKDNNPDYHILGAEINSSLNHFQQTLFHIQKAEALGVMQAKLYYLKSQAQRRLKQPEQAKKSLQIYEIVNALSNQTNAQVNLDNLNQLEQLAGQLNQDFNVIRIESYLKSLQHKLAKTHLAELNINQLSVKNRVKLLETGLMTRSDFVLNLLFDTIKPETTTPVEASLFCQYYSHSEVYKAINYCAQMLKQYPQVAPLYFWQAIALLKDNNLPQAIAQLQTAINFAPWVNAWRIQLAQVYLTEGKTQLAQLVVNSSIDKQDVQLINFKRKYGL